MNKPVLIQEVPQPQSAYVLFIKALRQKQKEQEAATAGQEAQPEAATAAKRGNNNFLQDASKQWGTLDPEEKKQYQDEANLQKQRYLEYKRALKESQQRHDLPMAAGQVDEEELHQQRRK